MATKVEALNVPAAGKARKKVSIVPYLFIAPHLLFFAAFLGWPFLYGIYISLFQFDFLRPERRPFVGLQNDASTRIIPIEQYRQHQSNPDQWEHRPENELACVA